MVWKIEVTREAEKGFARIDQQEAKRIITYLRKRVALNLYGSYSPLRQAELADQSTIADGMSIPEELERREIRLEAIAKAKREIEHRAEERYEKKGSSLFGVGSSMRSVYYSTILTYDNYPDFERF